MQEGNLKARRGSKQLAHVGDGAPGIFRLVDSDQDVFVETLFLLGLGFSALLPNLS